MVIKIMFFIFFMCNFSFSAVLLDGSDDTVIVPNYTAVQTQDYFTAEIWAYPIAYPDGNNRFIFSKWSSGGGSWGIFFQNSGGGQVNSTINNGSIFVNSGTNLLKRNTWTHIALTFNGSDLRLYFDGVQVGNGSVTATTMVENSGINVIIGAVSDLQANSFFNGYVSEAKIWNIALTPSEIINSMYVYRQTDSRLTYYVGIDEGANITAKNKYRDIDKTAKDASVNVTAWVSGPPITIIPMLMEQ